MNSKNKYRVFQEATKQAKENSLLEKIPAFFRMIKSWRNGEYKPRMRTLLLSFLAVIYVLIPIDIIPEFFFSIFGLADDIALLIFVFSKLMKEVDRFLEWERSAPPKHTIDTEAEIIN